MGRLSGKRQVPVMVALVAAFAVMVVSGEVGAGAAVVARAGAVAGHAVAAPTTTVPATWTEANGSGGTDPDTGCGNWFVTTPPPDTAAATVVLSGGGGGGGGYDFGSRPVGGTGAEVDTTLAVTDATGALAVEIGCGGGSGVIAGGLESRPPTTPGGVGYGTGGAGPAVVGPLLDDGSSGGGGGGGSGLCVAGGSGANASCATPLVVAGGGGGSGGEFDCAGSASAGNGGSGDGGSSQNESAAIVTLGAAGGDGNDGKGGGGGLGASGGMGGASASGSSGAGSGGNTPFSSTGGDGAQDNGKVPMEDSVNGGGGGGGYTGGGGGGSDYCVLGTAAAGGGGGGSSAVASAVMLGTPTVASGAAGGLGSNASTPSTVTCSAQGGQSYPSGCPGYVTVTWTRPTVTTSLTLSPDTSSFGQAVTLSAMVTGQPGVTPTGTVSFVDTVGGQVTTVAGGVALTNGTASTPVVLPAVGANSITATYSGDGNYASSTSPPVTATVNPVAHQLVVTQLRFSGPGATGRGTDDWYVDLENNTAFPLQLAGWILGIAYSDGGTAGLPMPAGLTLPPGGAYLAAGSDYSLGQVAVPDFALNDQLSADIIGAQIVPPNGGAVVDKVGYGNAPSGYRGSAGALPALTPAVPSPGVQYAFVRHGSQAVPVDTDDNGADFSLVSVTGGTVGGQTAIVGTPSPLSTATIVQQQANASMPSSLSDSAQPAGACPNRIYIPGTAGGPGTLVVNRTITNNTGHLITLTGLRITSLSEQGGPPSTSHAWLRAVPTTVTTSPCGGSLGHPLTLNGPAGASGDGGLGTTLAPSAPYSFVGPGASVTVAFQFDVDQGGPFTFGYDVDVQFNR